MRPYISGIFVAVLFLNIACSTSSKSSKSQYLTGGADVVATEEQILKDLARTVFIKEMAPPHTNEHQTW